MSKSKDWRKENVRKLLLRVELWFAPWLVIVPVSVSMLFFWDWYVRGFSVGSTMVDGELLIGLILLFGNILFDIPFLRSLWLLNKVETAPKKETRLKKKIS
ncbi:MAG: hypothetical protein V1726_03450 [Methanobacteriota archaeon]